MTRRTGLCLSLWLMPVLGGAVSAQQLEGLAGVDFVADERIFNVMCAIHAAGYDFQLAAADPASPRARVLGGMDLSAVSPELLGKMKDFFQRMNVELSMARQQAKYAALSLLLSPPPALEYREREATPTDDIRALAPFAPLVASFRSQAGLEGLWATWKPEALRFLALLREDIRTCVQGLLRMGNLEARLSLDRRLTVIPNLVDAPNTFLTVQVGGTYAVFVSPSISVQRYRKYFIHEYIHMLLDPVFDPLAARLDDDHDLSSWYTSRPEYARFTAEPSLAVRESLYNAIGLQVLAGIGSPATAAERNAMIKRDSPFLAWFEARVKGFSEAGKPLGEQVAALVKGLKTEEMLPSAGTVATVAAGSEEDPAVKRLDQVLQLERLLREGNAAEAERIASALVARDPSDAEALFFLGQVRYAQDRHADALAIYDRVLDLSLAPQWVRGWALVRSGNCLLRLDRPGEAVRRFREAASLTSGDRGAGEAARKSLERLETEK